MMTTSVGSRQRPRPDHAGQQQPAARSIVVVSNECNQKEDEEGDAGPPVEHGDGRPGVGLRQGPGEQAADRAARSQQGFILFLLYSENVLKCFTLNPIIF